MGENMERDNDKRDFFDGLNKADVYTLIEILQVKLEDQLNEPIRIKNKRYAKYHQGFSRFPLPLDTLQNVYYKSICQDHDIKLKSYANQMILLLLEELNEKIKISAVERRNISQGNSEAIKNLVATLIDTPFKRHMDMYFKLKGIEISNDIAEKINKEAQRQIHTKTLEKRLRKEEQAKYAEQLKACETQYTQLICEKDRQMQEQAEQIKSLEALVSEKTALMDRLAQERDKAVEEKEKLARVLAEYKAQQSEQAAAIARLEKERNTAKLIRYLTDKNDMDTLANRIVTELAKGQLREKFLDFMKRENIFPEIIRRDEMLYKDFCREANEKWEAEHQELFISKNQLKDQINALQKEKEHLADVIAGYIQQHDVKADELAKLEAKMQSFIETLDDEIYNHLFSKAIIKPFLHVQTEKLSSETDKGHLYVKEAVLSENVTEEFDFKEMADNIANNLECVGVSKNIAYEVACLFIGCICAGLTPLIYGYRTREVVDAIAAAVTGCSLRIVTLPPGFCDAVKVVKQFQNADSGTVLFEDAVGCMNEASLLPLLREKANYGQFIFDKLLVLSSENYEAVKYMPLNLWSYLVLITVEDFEPPKQGGFICRKSQEAFRRLRKQTAPQKYSGKVAALTANMGLFQLYNLQREKIINYISTVLSESTAITAIAVLELLTIAKATGVLETFNENVKTSVCDERFKKIIEKELLHERSSL